jgi:adenosylcobinamide kinase/adenosylcobinamide-phosphate guanylyltransferase
MKTLVIGGAASGKSEYAESLAADCLGTKYYIATLIPCDIESRMRIERHSSMRQSKGFETIERYTGLSELVVPKSGTVLLECLGNLVANEMFSDGGAKKNSIAEITQGLSSLEKQSENLIIVTNDVFSDGEDYSGGSKEYLDVLAAVNAAAAKIADNVIEVVCGIPIAIKGAVL